MGLALPQLQGRTVPLQLFPEFSGLPSLSQGEKCAAANSNKIFLEVSVVTVSFKRGVLRAQGVLVSVLAAEPLVPAGAAGGRGWQQELSDNHGPAGPGKPRGCPSLGAASAPGAASVGEGVCKAATLFLRRKTGKKRL